MQIGEFSNSHLSPTALTAVYFSIVCFFPSRSDTANLSVWHLMGCLLGTNRVMLSIVKWGGWYNGKFFAHYYFTDSGVPRFSSYTQSHLITCCLTTQFIQLVSLVFYSLKVKATFVTLCTTVYLPLHRPLIAFFDLFILEFFYRQTNFQGRYPFTYSVN